LADQCLEKAASLSLLPNVYKVEKGGKINANSKKLFTLNGKYEGQEENPKYVLAKEQTTLTELERYLEMNLNESPTFFTRRPHPTNGNFGLLDYKSLSAEQQAQIMNACVPLAVHAKLDKLKAAMKKAELKNRDLLNAEAKDFLYPRSRQTQEVSGGGDSVR
jgi:hypothetical protein